MWKALDTLYKVCFLSHRQAENQTLFFAQVLCFLSHNTARGSNEIEIPNLTSKPGKSSVGTCLPGSHAGWHMFAPAGEKTVQQLWSDTPLILISEGQGRRVRYSVPSLVPWCSKAAAAP